MRPEPVAPPPARPAASPLPPPPAPELPVEVTEREVTARIEDRWYRVRGLDRNLSAGLLKVNLLVRRGEAVHVDTLDLYSARQRAAYVQAAAAELGASAEAVKRDVGRLLLRLEALQDERIRGALEPAAKAPEMSEAEREAALDLLRSPDLLERIVADFERAGVVGEETNKWVGYLAAVSRKLERPLAVLVQSSFAAGKTSLMDAVLAFVPEEERVQYSALTGQSLFYMEGVDLRHKVLAVSEEEGAERASYALKLLQSEGRLTIASTGKDPETGRLTTHEYRVEGPVAIFLTTTAVEVDEELLNRALVLTVDEERAQTRRVHEAQRRSRTLEGLLSRREREAVLGLHRNAQRLLRPLAVVNPYAPSLTFLDARIRTRRDHEKYLTLIDAVALLHQHQREVKHAWRGRVQVEYVEVTPDDIRIANRLAGEVLGRSLDELPPQTRRFLQLLSEWVGAEAERQGTERSEVRFSAREAREALGTGATQTKVHLARLAELEYVLACPAGPGRRSLYRLAYGGEGEDGRPFLPGLLDPEALEAGSTYDADRSASGGERPAPNGRRPGRGRAPAGHRSAGGRSGESAPSSFSRSHLQVERPERKENASAGEAEARASYVAALAPGGRP